MIVTNGTRVAYWDKELIAAVVFDTMTGRVIALTQSWERAQDIVEKGLPAAQRSVPPIIRTVMTSDEKHSLNEYRRKAGMKFPGAFIF